MNGSVVYSRVALNISAQSGVMLWIHQTLAEMFYCYKFWNNRIIRRGEI